jgi:mRNA interferase YafQ
MYSIVYSNSFKKDSRRCKKRNYDFNIFRKVLTELIKKGKLQAKHKPHKLSGNYEGFWECHIKPDWLLIWMQDDINKLIILDRTGTHSDLFK